MIPFHGGWASSAVEKTEGAIAGLRKRLDRPSDSLQGKPWGTDDAGMPGIGQMSESRQVLGSIEKLIKLCTLQPIFTSSTRHSFTLFHAPSHLNTPHRALFGDKPNAVCSCLNRPHHV